MKERNSFFASVFSQEFDRWKKETGKTSAQFAELIDVHPNNIGRYKKGDAFPSDRTMGLICDVLGVESSAFQPSSVQDLIKFDPVFRTAATEILVENSIKAVETIGISSVFFAYLLDIPEFEELFPFSNDDTTDNEPCAYANCGNLYELVRFNKQDLEWVKTLQAKVEEYILAMLCKAKHDITKAKN